MKWKIIKITAFVFLVSSIFFAIFSQVSFAQVTDVVNFSVKISVCGDFIIEGSEDCEWLDLNGQSCESLGYKSGELYCDISCEFETGFCVPFPEPEPEEPEPEKQEPKEPEAEEEPDESPKLPTQLIITPDDAFPIIPSLPEFLELYDINGDGRLDSSELESVVQLWVNIWRNIVYDEGNTTCDLNDDEECNIFDFSVLMYYIEK